MMGKAIEEAISCSKTTEVRHLEKILNKGKCDWGKSNEENCTQSLWREWRSIFHWIFEVL